MALSSEAKLHVMEQYRRFEKDTGSSEVQIALLSSDIRRLTDHMQINRNDKHSKRGLLLKVSRRNRLLRYLKRTKSSTYQTLIQSLGLRDKA